MIFYITLVSFIAYFLFETFILVHIIKLLMLTVNVSCVYELVYQCNIITGVLANWRIILSSVGIDKANDMQDLLINFGITC